MVQWEDVELTMADSKPRRTGRGHRPIETIAVRLSLDEVSTLIRLSSNYGRTLDVVLRTIQVVSPGEMRVKARFMREEAYWLRRFAEAQRDRMESQGATESHLDFTPRTLVAFYGRTLASLNLPRTRRRMSPDKIAARESLADKLRAALMVLCSTDLAVVEAEVETRRLREREWIFDRLDLPVGSNGVSGEAH